MYQESKKLLMNDLVKLLVVEDCELDRQLIRYHFKNEQSQVSLTEASDIIEAKAAICESDFDCILLDYNLPEGKCVEVLKLANESSRKCPVIVMTSSEDASVVDHCLSNGAQDFLNKSEINRQTLLHAIEFARKRHDYEQTNQKFALHDPLTGLGNRQLYIENLKKAIFHSQRCGKKVGLLLLDIDNFKKINDTHGHPAGDESLKHVAKRLRESVRNDDSIARFGGDEFAIIIEELDDIQDCTRVAKKILEKSEDPMVLDSLAIPIKHSIGIAISDFKSDCDSLISQADIALYSAKTKGKSCYEIFNEELKEYEETEQRKVRSVSEAISAENYTFNFQPIYDACREIQHIEIQPQLTLQNQNFSMEYRDLLNHDYSSLINVDTELKLAGYAIEALKEELSIIGSLSRHRKLIYNVSPDVLTNEEISSAIIEKFESIGLQPSSLLFCVNLNQHSKWSNYFNSSQISQSLLDKGIKTLVANFSLDHPVSSLLDPLHFGVRVDIGQNSRCSMHELAQLIRLCRSTQLRLFADNIERASIEKLIMMGVDCMQGDQLMSPIPALAMNSLVHAQSANANNNSDKQSLESKVIAV